MGATHRKTSDARAQQQREDEAQQINQAATHLIEAAKFAADAAVSTDSRKFRATRSASGARNTRASTSVCCRYSMTISR